MPPPSDSPATPLSVVIPCHNPRRDYLPRVLAALEAQTLPRNAWDLLVVDNASAPPVATWTDLSWHPRGRIVREEKLGLTPARLRGFRETRGDFVVMVDDDNVLAPDYLEQALRIRTTLPCLGAFGGHIDPEFEEPPPAWTRPYWATLAVRPVPRSVWTNDVDHWAGTPCGAGLCVTRAVAEQYARSIATDPLRLSLGRSGDSLVSGEDEDIAWTACSMGLGMGRFRELTLKHLIPPVRLTEKYLCRIQEGQAYSGAILDALWHRAGAGEAGSGLGRLLRLGWQSLRREWTGRQILAARRRGVARAQKQLEQLKHD